MDRKLYYSQPMILYNIIPQLKFRYLSVRRQSKKDSKKSNLSRYYMGYNLELLKDSLERNEVLTNISTKIYFDLATWKDDSNTTPLFSFDQNKRKEQRDEFSKQNKWKKLIKSYDFAIDIDSKDIKKAWKEAEIIKEIFDDYKLPYSLRFSGSKGFHFVIDSKFIKLRTRPINLATKFADIVNNLVRDEKLEYVDLSIYDPRRILKIAYSLVNNKGEEYVCLPLTDEQFNDFKYEDMKLSNVIKNVKLFKRGIIERNFGLTEKQLSSNFIKFVKEYE